MRKHNHRDPFPWQEWQFIHEKVVKICKKMINCFCRISLDTDCGVFIMQVGAQIIFVNFILLIIIPLYSMQGVYCCISLRYTHKFYYRYPFRVIRMVFDCILQMKWRIVQFRFHTNTGSILDSSKVTSLSDQCLASKGTINHGNVMSSIEDEASFC